MSVDSLGVLLRGVQGYPSIVPIEEVRNLANTVAPPPSPPPQASSSSLSSASSSVIGGGAQDTTLAASLTSVGSPSLAGTALPLSLGTSNAFDLTGW